MTIHDLAFEIVPQFANQGLRRYLSSVVPRQVNNAAAIATISETSKRDLVERLSADADRVVVIPNAADERFFAAEPLDHRQRERLGIPLHYLLVVGTIEPRKNHLTLFRALKLLPPDLHIPLVIVGGIGWDADRIVAEAKALAGEGAVIMPGYFPDESLPGLYAGAQAVISPSWYEGFGLPVLEGLAAAAPVIASDIPAHREIAGDAAAFVPPGDPEALAIAISGVVSSEVQGDAARAGRQLVARAYAWDHSGQKLAELIERVASK